MHQKFPTIHRFFYRNEEVSKRPGIFHTIKIHIVESGTAIWNINGKDFSIYPGLAFLMGNGERRYFKSICGTLTLLVCEMDITDLLPEQRPLFINRPPQLPLFFKLNEVPEFKSYFYTAFAQSQKKEPFCALFAKGYISLALASLLRHFAPVLPDTPEKMRPEIEAVLQYISSHITENLSLSHLSALVHLSPSALSKQFAKYNGLGFHQYISSKRIEMAIELLRSTEKSVLDIAYACGFHNSAAYYDAFKKTTGVTPLSFRNKRFSSV